MASNIDGLRDDQWERLKAFVPGGIKGKRGRRSKTRLFLDALLWMARSGARWSDLPECFGKPDSVKRRYYRWVERGVFAQMLETFADEADLEWLTIDSTIVRAHQHAAGAPKVKGAHAQGLGRSRGGLSTKIHAATDALGNPLRLIAGPGQEHDMAKAAALVDGLAAAATIADKGYDADHLHDQIVKQGSEVVIPPRRNRKDLRAYDKHLYKERNRIERFFAKLKQFRRVATRYDKLLQNFMGFVAIAAISIWIR